MPFIKFLQSVVVDDNKKGTAAQTSFEAGRTYELPLASCQRWKKRAVAVDVSPEEYTKLMAKTDAAAPRAPKSTVVKPQEKAFTEPTKVTEHKTVTPVAPATEEKSESKLIEVSKETPVEAAPTPALTKADIPADWNTMSWPKLKTLASKLSSEPVTTRLEANKIIEAELAKA